MAAAAILNSDLCDIFGQNRCVLHWIRNIFTKFGEICKEMATVFRNSSHSAFFDLTVVFYIGFAKFS